MAFPIIPKKRSGATGSPTSLTVGELAVNTATGELFLGGDESVLLLNPPTAAGTTVTEHTGDGTTLAFTFSGYNGTADGGYLVSVGGIDQPPSKYAVTSTAGGTITFVEAPTDGELISIRALVASSGGGGGGITELTGDVTASGTGSVAATLASITTAQSEIGSSTQIPIISIDAKGRVTALSSVVSGYDVGVLVVAGGGGATGAGGGAGGFIENTCRFFSASVYSVTVGSGGAGASPTTTAAAVSGSNSSITIIPLTAIGGGRAGTGAVPNGSPGGNGGSGGGAGPNGSISNTTITGGSGTVGQGNNGGSTPGLAGSPSGGGGGAGAVGANGVAGAGGNGGVGLQSSVTGSSIYYAGGGGGAIGSAGTQGTGGLGGGGNAAQSGTGASGTINTGGGGGAASNAGVGGNGGSGVVILSVPTAFYTGTVTGSPTVTTSGANTIVKFTSSGTYTA